MLQVWHVGISGLPRLKVVIALPRLIKYALVVVIVVLVRVGGVRLVLCHLVYRVCHIVGGICRLIYLFVVVVHVYLWLIAILEPVVEVVAELLQQIHIAGVVVSFYLAAHCCLVHVLLVSMIHISVWVVCILFYLISKANHVVQVEFDILTAATVNYVFAISEGSSSQNRATLRDAELHHLTLRFHVLLDEDVHGSPIPLIKILESSLEPELRARSDLAKVLMLDIFLPRLQVCCIEKGVHELSPFLQGLYSLEFFGVHFILVGGVLADLGDLDTDGGLGDVGGVGVVIVFG